MSVERRDVRSTTRLLSAAGLVLTALVSTTDAGDSPKSPQPSAKAAAVAAEQTVDLICLAPKRPILIRLHITVDGKSFSDYRTSVAKRFFDALDADKNGFLEGKELSSLPSPQMVAAAGREPDGLPQGVPASATALPNKSRVSLAEWTRVLFPAARGPLSHISFASMAPTNYPDALQENPIDGNELAAILSAIDSNGDGQLSVSELSRPDDLFRLLDVNDDEQISRTEFIAPIDLRWKADPAAGGGSRPSAPLEIIPPAGARTALVQRLIQTYGAGTDAKATQSAVKTSPAGKQPPKTLGVPLSIFASTDQPSRFDKNRDGLLDEQELLAWLSDSPPRCELTVEMAMLSLDEPRVRVMHTALSTELADFSAEMPVAGRALLRFASVPLELRAAEGSRRATRTSRYRALFKRADQNNNNYIENSEIPYLGPGLGSLDFAAMDRDHNGMVFEDEYVDYLRLRDALADSRLGLMIDIESIDPLGQFDATQDGRLNRAEFGRLLATVAAWDVNHDGIVTPQEIPRKLIGTFHIGERRSAGMRRSRAGRMAEGKQPPSEGPVWFQKMDRNHDGEVSLREFLGPLAVFRRLDTNGDGRLNLHEAQAAQK